METKNTERIKALDTMRGITVAGMILVNNPGAWNTTYAPLLHAEFNGMTPTDLVFPFFMFIMGISIYISMQKFDFAYSFRTVTKILRRTVILFIIGLCLNLLIGLLHYGEHWLTALRYMGVMQRLGLCYGIVALLALTLRHRYFPYLIAILYMGYASILLVGNGFDYSSENIVCQVDTALMGASHLYLGDGFPFDPEGLLSTLPAIGHVMIGFCCGKILMKEIELSKKMNQLFLLGCILMILGWLLSYGIPLNKKVWTPTFSMMTSGMAACLLAGLIELIDIRKFRYTGFFNAFGANPLFIFVISEVMSIFMLASVFHQLILPIFPTKLASLISAVIMVFLCWLIVYPLYKRHLYIKI